MPLAKLYMKKYSADFKKEISGLDKKAEQVIRNHPWAGNILELENCIRKAVILAQAKTIMPEDLEISYWEEQSGFFDLSKAMEKFEKEFLGRALRRNSGNITKATKQFGISRPKLYEMVYKYRKKI